MSDTGFASEYATPATVNLAKKLQVEPKALAHFQKSMGVLLEFAMANGFSPKAIAAVTGEEIRQVIEDPAATAYATPEEGLALLLNEEGGCVDVETAAALYRKPDPVKPAAITQKIRNRDMVAYKTAASQYRVPRWQFRREGGLLPGLSEVLHALGAADKSYSHLTPFAFFLQSHPLTGEHTPLELLRIGDADTVLRAARSEEE
jgi:hypothetical protein